MRFDVTPYFETNRICLDLYVEKLYGLSLAVFKTDLSIEEVQGLIYELENALIDMEKFKKDLDEYMGNEKRKEENNE